MNQASRACSYAVSQTDLKPDGCSEHGLKTMVRVIFANDACVEQYGEPRSQEECSRLLSLMSEEQHERRRTWLTKAAMVCMSRIVACLCLQAPMLSSIPSTYSAFQVGV